MHNLSRITYDIGLVVVLLLRVADAVARARCALWGHEPGIFLCPAHKPLAPAGYCAIDSPDITL